MKSVSTNLTSLFSPARPIPAPCDTSSLLTTCTVPPREPLCPQHPQVHLITWLVLFTSWLSLSMTVSGHWNRLSSWPSSSSSSSSAAAAAARLHPCHHHLPSKFWLQIYLQNWCQYTAKTACWDLIQSNLPMTWLVGLRVKSKTGGLVAYTMDTRCIHIWSYRANLVVIILVFLYFEIFTARHTQPTSLCWRGHHRVGGNNDSNRRLTCSPKSTAEILCNLVNPVRVITTLW